MCPAWEEGSFLDCRGRGVTAEEILNKFPLPSHFYATLDGGAVPDKAALMGALAAAFSFPAYFGKNWDALLDCLRTLPDEIPAKGYVLIINNASAFLAGHPQDLAAFKDVALEAATFLADKFKSDFTTILL